MDRETRECGERRLRHESGEAEQFYREPKKKGVSVRVGIEATGHSRWFERLLAELNFELWVGEAAQIRAKRVRKRRNDRFDAQHILKLMLEGNFPRIWVPTAENRDLRQLVLSRRGTCDREIWRKPLAFAADAEGYKPVSSGQEMLTVDGSCLVTQP